MLFGLVVLVLDLDPLERRWVVLAPVVALEQAAVLFGLVRWALWLLVLGRLLLEQEAITARVLAK